jgi:hypothetical protein
MESQDLSNNDFINEIINITNDRKFKKFFKESVTSPISSFLLNEIYPYVYLSIILVIISFLLILSIFLLLIRQFSVVNALLSKDKVNTLTSGINK